MTQSGGTTFQWPKFNPTEQTAVKLKKNSNFVKPQTYCDSQFGSIKSVSRFYHRKAEAEMSPLWMFLALPLAVIVLLSACSSHQSRLPKQGDYETTLIRPIECRNLNNNSELGICMFSIDCMHNKGVPLSVCKHNYFVGTCCKLPDHNNFVGIVYDLRQTENGGHLLEARKTQLQSNSHSPSELKGISSLTTQPQFPTTDFLVHQSASPTDSVKQVNEQFAAFSKPEDRYIISSSSLFPETLISSTSSIGIQTSSSQQSTTSSPVESARNAGGVASSTRSIVSNELDSFDIQSLQNQSLIIQQAPAVTETGTAPFTSAIPDTQTDRPSSIKLTAPSTRSEDNADILGTVTSAHSSHIPVKDLKTADSIGSSPVTETTATSELASGSTREASQIVISNQHRSPINELAASSVAAQSEQEFTLSTSGSSQSSVPLSSVGDSSSVDLISQPNSSSQTTTPFTTSLSTAQIPNVSLYSQALPQSATGSTANLPSIATGTVAATATTASSTQTQNQTQTQAPTQLQSNATSTGGSQLLVSPVSSTSLPSVSSASSRPTSWQTRQPPESSSFGFGQLYTNQHGQQQAPNLRPTLSNSLSHLQSASKTVAASSAGQNLIPGLSNLQSAILSHIPFKLPTGLSSSLTSYLQNAMKPNGGNRPLLASNTAPATQFQLSLQSSAAAAATKLKFPGSTATPTSASTSSASQETTTSTSSSSQTPIVSWPSPSQIATLMPAQSATQAVPSAFREAQLVCGRPQVAQQTQQKVSQIVSNSLGSGSGPEPLAIGKKRVARIVGGNQSLFGQWPWMVSLRQWRKGAFLHKCGAALLNENWAITAAHCVENVKPGDLLLRLGEFDVSNQDEPYPFIERRIKSVVSHPQFDPKTFEYDLALMRFSEPVKFERNVLPVCVPAGNDSYVDRMATVIGWGRLHEDGPLPDIIQHVEVPIITNEECEKMYKAARFQEEIPDMFICAGISEGGRDSCEGDSGGPLTMVDTDGRAYLVGIISWGIGCALPNQPGVYTRITKFSSWINQIAATT